MEGKNIVLSMAERLLCSHPIAKQHHLPPRGRGAVDNNLSFFIWSRHVLPSIFLSQKTSGTLKSCIMIVISIYTYKTFLSFEVDWPVEERRRERERENVNQLHNSKMC